MVCPMTSANAGPIVELRDVRLKLESLAGEVNILRGLDLVVGRGESVAVLGPSGSGKSTMMMVMAGLERASSGIVRVAGEDLGALDEDGLALFRRRHVGIVFQGFHLIPTMTATFSLACGGARAAFAPADAALAAVGLGHRLSHYPGQLSGGEQQRVALARAVVGEPDLVLADEPTGNLDHATGAQVMDLLFGLAGARGATLVLITHDLALARRCARVVRLQDGRIAGDAPAAPAAP
jgi:putative ABC transport system ATP-binding protein